MAAKTCYLIVDNRERNVTRHATELADTPHKLAQMTIGDYAVVDPQDRILAVFERKSLEDFAASFKDGRALNKEKLFALRNRTGCHVIYIIEGPHARADATFGRTPYSAIESSVFHLMMRDNVQVIRTLNTLETAATLARFVRSMNTLLEKTPTEDILGPVVGGQTEIGPTSGGGEQQNNQTADAVAALTVAIPINDFDVVRELWSVFRGVSVEKADDFASKFTIAQVVTKSIPATTLATFKLASGRKPSHKVIGQIQNPALLSERFLACIPGISRATAATILTGRTLVDLLAMPPTEISKIKIGKSQRALGQTAATNIIKYFTMLVVPPTPVQMTQGVATSQ